MGQQNDRKAISLDLATGAVREYSIDLVSIDAIGVNSDYAFVTNDLNGVGHVGRIDIETGDTLAVDLGSAAGQLICDDSKVCVFWIEFGRGEPDRTYLSGFNEDLSVASTADLAASGIEVPMLPTALTNGRIYFVSYHQPKSEHDDARFTIAFYSAENNSVGHFAAPGQGAKDYEVSHLLPLDVGLLVFGYMPGIDGKPGTGLVELLDYESGELIDSFAVDYVPSQCVIWGDWLFVLGATPADMLLV
jgi:hypothetical protein